MEKIIAILMGLLILNSCALPGNDVDIKTLYKRDLVMEINGRVFHGTAAPIRSDKYKIHIYAKGDLDLFTFETCHREESTESAWNVVKRQGLFKRKVKKKRELEFTYSPTELERTQCSVLLGGYEAKKGRHSWAFIDFQDKKLPLYGTSVCNGKSILNPTVSVCQAKTGLIQLMKFSEPVTGDCEDGCGLTKSTGKDFYIDTARGHCACMFKSKDGRSHRLTTIGYDRILMRQK